ncbi:putative multiple inositol polyphosphate phosphatase 1-like [Scophthalmus maximus]|uniref:Putative multiple inositol polyphosphate phosphatase 1-like n=1 Tax=Scophthalmus maximus TaxID=52904 RepID=A0A2U9CCU5_SCOMX|nr:putative multiple inositol polyphosphate phosphatase 1-like [Scophthalmus maximus]
MLAVNRSVLQPPSAHCREIHLTAIIRHGTRYPTTKDIKEMQQLHNNVLHNALGEERWLQEIKTQWTMWYTEDMDGRLVQKGVSDLKHSGREKLRSGLIQFMTSSKHRCVNSTLSLKAGLTGLWAITDKEFNHTMNDSLMRFFDKVHQVCAGSSQHLLSCDRGGPVQAGPGDVEAPGEDRRLP